MNNKDLHTLLSQLARPRPALPGHKARLKAALQHEHIERSSRQASGTFIQQLLRKGKRMKLSFASPLMVVGTVLLAGTASAAVYWFNTSVSSNQRDNIVSISAENCPSKSLSEQKAVGMTLPRMYSFKEKYEIIDSSKISKQTIAEAQLVKCEQRAIVMDINNAFPDMQEFKATNDAPNSKGLYAPRYASGTVKAVNGDMVTIAITQYERYSTKNVDATLRLADDALLTKKGTKISSLKMGDKIYFAYQNRANASETAGEHNPGPQSVIRGAGIITTDGAANDQLYKAINTGAVKVLESDPQLG